MMLRAGRNAAHRRPPMMLGAGASRRHASSSASAGLPFRDWWRAGVSLQVLGGVTLGATVLWQAGQQAALERKLALLERALAAEQPQLHSTYTATSQEPTLHKHSALQRIGEKMLGQGHKFGDLIAVLALFPLACAAVGAMSTRANSYMLAKRSVEVAKRRALGAEGAELRAVVQKSAPKSVAVEAAVAKRAIAVDSTIAEVAQPVAVETSVAKWQQSRRSASQMGRKERSKSLAMRRSMVKGSLGAPSLLHARRAFARKRVTVLPVMMQHRAPAPLLPLPSHGLQMAKVRAESGENDTMMAHVMDEHAALQHHLEAIVEPTVKPDSQFALEAAEEYDPVREMRRAEAEDIRIAKAIAAERASAKMLAKA